MEMNYFKWVDSDGKTIGVVEAGQGTVNEFRIVGYLIDQGFTPIKITKEEYMDFDEGDEFVLSKS